MKQKRTLIPTKTEHGVPVAGRCSVCHRPFDVLYEEGMLLGSASQELLAMFDDHTCNEDVNQAAARIVRETTPH